jgi:hypothetical protein
MPVERFVDPAACRISEFKELLAGRASMCHHFGIQDIYLEESPVEP